MYLGGANFHELQRGGPRVVMGHTMRWRDSDEVSSRNVLVLFEPQTIALNDLLDQSLWSMGCLEGGQDGCARRTMQLRGEYVDSLPWCSIQCS